MFGNSNHRAFKITIQLVVEGMEWRVTVLLPAHLIHTSHLSSKTLIHLHRSICGCVGNSGATPILYHFIWGWG